MTDTPWDVGLQNERTRLAWQRTTLSGLVCCLLAARLLASVAILPAIGLVLAALASSAILGWFSSRRYRVVHLALHTDRPIGDGRPHAVIATLTTVTAVATLLYTVLQ